MSINKQKISIGVEQQFEEDAKQVASVSESTLLKLLSENKDTEYGKKYDFANITNIKQFKEIHPLTKYEHYRPYIERMLNGEENILTANRVTFFAMTSGTTSMGKKKIIPNTNYRCPFPWISLIEAALSKAFPLTKEFRTQIMIVNANGQEKKTASGVRLGVAGTARLPKMMQMNPFPFTSPKGVFELTDVKSATYLHAFYGLKNPNISSILTTFVTVLLNYFQCIEQHWREMVRDIRYGTISNRDLILPLEIKQSLLEQLQGDRERADELEKIFEAGLENLALRLWPDLQYTQCLAGGTFSIYVDKCQKYLGSVPIYSRAYGASEGLFGINLWPKEHTARFVPVPQERYTEYIPVAQTNSDFPTTLELSELKEGESYEVVMSNFDGLYRYRMGDIIKVVGRYHQLPIYELVGRAGTLLDICGEKITEEMSCSSINRSIRGQSYNLVDYTTTIDTNFLPPRYIFFVELELSSPLSQTATSQLETILARELDRNLQSVNPIYESKRTTRSIGSPKVLLVKKDTFKAVTALLVKGGASPLQVKMLRYVRRRDILTLLQKNTSSQI